MKRRFWAIVAVLPLFGPGQSRAEEFPWCVELDTFTRNCAYEKYDECASVAHNAVSPATGTPRCVRNPQYQPPAVALAKPSKSKPANAKPALAKPALAKPALAKPASAKQP